MPRPFVFPCLALALLTACPKPARSQEAATKQESVGLSADKTRFVLKPSGRRFLVWGVNYDHDVDGKLLEDYWANDWDRIVGDFREIKALGANVVRIHLQTGRFLKSPTEVDDANLKRLADLVRLAEETGLYLDVTGLACYHKSEVPRWYETLDETARWEAQTTFWKAVAAVGKGSPAIFCYDLMNEPILLGGADAKDWLPGPAFGDSHFVQRITLDLRGRTTEETAKAWVEKLTGAIRSVDVRHLITVGVIPWAQAMPGARPLFESPDVGGSLDFASIHLYPRKDKLEDDLKALRTYNLGKPLVIEEIFPLSASQDETIAFMEKARGDVDGWVSFYWGKPADELDMTKDMSSVITAAWLRKFKDLGPKMIGDKP